MTDVDSRAIERAKEIAWDAIAPAYHEGAAEGAEDVLLEDDLWKWLVVAADRAEDMEAYRALDLNHDEQRHDELRGHLAKAHAHLVSARDLRRDELLAGVIDGYDPEDVFKTVPE
jgi:hypothetical protein